MPYQFGNAVAIDGAEIGLSVAIDGGEIGLISDVSGEIGEFYPLLPDAYSGITEVTPTSETQTLYTMNLVMPSHVTINPIPSNYGLITWNGSILTVS